MIDHPIDYVLGAGELGLRANIRFFFSSCFMFVSIGLLFIVVALKVSLHLSGEDLNPFDLTTDAKSSMFVFFVSLSFSSFFFSKDFHNSSYFIHKFLIGSTHSQL